MTQFQWVILIDHQVIPFQHEEMHHGPEKTIGETDVTEADKRKEYLREDHAREVTPKE